MFQGRTPLHPIRLSIVTVSSLSEILKLSFTVYHQCLQFWSISTGFTRIMAYITVELWFQWACIIGNTPVYITGCNGVCYIYIHKQCRKAWSGTVYCVIFRPVDEFAYFVELKAADRWPACPLHSVCVALECCHGDVTLIPSKYSPSDPADYKPEL